MAKKKKKAKASKKGAVATKPKPKKRKGMDADDRKTIKIIDNTAERVQASIGRRILPELTALGTVRFAFSQDLVSRAVLRESLEATVALLWKPPSLDWLTLSGRYSRVQRRWFLAETGGEAEDQSDIIGAAALLDLPWGISLTERILFRHRAGQK